MWQHRQEERVLKRAEMDVLKQRKNLEDTMRKLNTGNIYTHCCLHSPGPFKGQDNVFCENLRICDNFTTLYYTFPHYLQSWQRGTMMRRSSWHCGRKDWSPTHRELSTREETKPRSTQRPPSLGDRDSTNRPRNS